MKRRLFGKTGQEVSILGFGAMRLPTVGGLNHQVDEDRAVALIRSAIDGGVSYVDTAYPYHSESMAQGGQSEPVVARALRDGYRARVKLATKLPTWIVRTRQDMDRLLDEQLGRLETSCIDFYLVHGLSLSSWERVRDLGVAEFLDQAQRDGRIGHAGFSFHDEQKAFFPIVDGYDWSFCMIQYSYLDEAYQAGRAGLDYAAARGLGVAVMEPLRGGVLAGGLPPRAEEVFDGAEVKRSPVEWALRWIWNHPQVGVVLSGMSAPEHVQENLRFAASAEADGLTDDELQRVERVREIFAETIKVPCTACGYCMPCPAGVHIPKNFAAYNNYFLLDGSERAAAHRSVAAMHWTFTVPQSERAEACVACGQCLEHCPQGIAIPDELQRVAEHFARPEGSARSAPAPEQTRPETLDGPSPETEPPLADHVLTILAVRDLRRATEFYRCAFGWPLQVEVPVYVEFRLSGGQRLGLYERAGFARNTGHAPAMAPEGSTTGTEIYLHCADLDRAEDALRRAGARLLSPRALREWGEEAAYYADPDGNVVVVAAVQRGDGVES